MILFLFQSKAYVFIFQWWDEAEVTVILDQLIMIVNSWSHVVMKNYLANQNICISRLEPSIDNKLTIDTD